MKGKVGWLEQGKKIANIKIFVCSVIIKSEKISGSSQGVGWAAYDVGSGDGLQHARTHTHTHECHRMSAEV